MKPEGRHAWNDAALTSSTTKIDTTRVFILLRNARPYWQHNSNKCVECQIVLCVLWVPTPRATHQSALTSIAEKAPLISRIAVLASWSLSLSFSDLLLSSRFFYWSSFFHCIQMALKRITKVDFFVAHNVPICGILNSLAFCLCFIHWMTCGLGIYSIVRRTIPRRSSSWHLSFPSILIGIDRSD
jgi:hypothetical protein